MSTSFRVGRHGGRKHPARMLALLIGALLSGCEADECALDGTVWLGPNPNCPPGSDNSYGACTAPRFLFSQCAAQLHDADTYMTFTYRVSRGVVELTSEGTVPPSSATLGDGDTMIYRGEEYTLTTGDPDESWWGDRP